MDDQQTIAARIREGIAALRAGDRPGAQAIFQELTGQAPGNEHAWIGLALSSPSPAEAAAALHQAEGINPGSRFVSQAETDLTARLPGFADALAAERGTLDLGADPGALLPTDANIEAATAPVPTEPDFVVISPIADVPAEAPAEVPTLGTGPRLDSGRVAAAPTDSPGRRVLLNALLGLGSLVAIALLGFAIFTTLNLAPPPAATPTPAPPTIAVRATMRPTQAATQPSVAQLSPTAGANNPVGTATVANSQATLTAVAVAIATGQAIDPSLSATAEAQSTAPPAVTPTPDVARQAMLDAVRAGQYATAIPALELASERQPGDPELLYYLAVAYLSAPDRPHGAEDATLTLRSLQAVQPHWAPGLDLLARSLIAQKQYREAVTPAHQAVEADPSRAEYWMTLGAAYEGAGAKPEADKAYAEAVRHNPTPAAGGSTPGATPSGIAIVITPPSGATAVLTGTLTPNGTAIVITPPSGATAVLTAGATPNGTAIVITPPSGATAVLTGTLNPSASATGTLSGTPATTPVVTGSLTPGLTLPTPGPGATPSNTVAVPATPGLTGTPPSPTTTATTTPVAPGSPTVPPTTTPVPPPPPPPHLR